MAHVIGQKTLDVHADGALASKLGNTRLTGLPIFECLMRPLFPIVALFLPGLLNAQQMALSGGNLSIAGGTTVRIENAVEWQIAVDAQVINDGRIELPDGARIAETAGSPITGSGTEHSWTEAAQMQNEISGGLGLELTTGSVIGPLEIVRGHVPIAMGNGEQSVARWFILNGTLAPIEALVFHFDPTEANGATAAELDIHDADDTNGPWVPMLAAANGDPYALEAFAVQPRQHITAFLHDAATGMSEIEAESGFVVQPTLIIDRVTVRSVENAPIGNIELFDQAGRTIGLRALHLNGGTIDLDLSDLSAGSYFLRINGRHNFKVVKQ